LVAIPRHGSEEDGNEQESTGDWQDDFRHGRPSCGRTCRKGQPENIPWRALAVGAVRGPPVAVEPPERVASFRVVGWRGALRASCHLPFSPCEYWGVAGV
jgi:hypothetical protein